MRSREWIAIGLVLAAACGCATAPTAPADWLPDPDQVGADPEGAWIQLDYQTPEGPVDLDGELLAIQDLKFYVLRGDAVVGVSIDSVFRARLTYFDAHAGGVAGLVALGTISTISNGAYLAFTAPLWIVAGSVTASARSHEPVLEFPDEGWQELVPYARFPQGMPPDFVPRSRPPVVEPVAEPVEKPVEKPVVESVPAPEPLVPVARTRSNWGFVAGLGITRFDNEDVSGGLGAVLGLNVGKKWATGGVRFAIGRRELAALPGATETDDHATVVDMGVLVGVRGGFRAVRMALRAGPAAWGGNFGDLADLKLSFAAQGELVAYLWPNVGIGALVAYNDNDVEDFYVVTLGIAIGAR